MVVMAPRACSSAALTVSVNSASSPMCGSAIRHGRAQGDGRGRVARRRLDHDVGRGQRRQFGAHGRLLVGGGHHQDVVRVTERGRATRRSREQGFARTQPQQLLGMAPPAGRPQPGPPATGEDEGEDC